MRIDETYEYKRIVSLLEGIQYSRDNPRLNHFYHKGFLIAVLAQMARDDNKTIHYLEVAKENLVKNGWRRGPGQDLTKTEPEQ
jgi:hypothetical protein